jgi:hypothetical protein
MMAPAKRLSVLAAIVLCAALVFGAAPAPAAARPCWHRLIDDWWDGQIDNFYPDTCYRAAMRNAPEDLRSYSDLESDLARALANMHTVSGSGGGRYVVPGAEGHRSTTRAGGGRHGTQTTRSAPRRRDAVVIRAARGSDAQTSIPVPLIGLAGLALLPLAAGFAGLLRRRLRGRGTSSGDD